MKYYLTINIFEDYLMISETFMLPYEMKMLIQIKWKKYNVKSFS
jgi:hypothetical protein